MTQSEQYRTAVAEHRAKHGQRETQRIIKQIAGVDDLWSVPECKQRDVIGALKEPEGNSAKAFLNRDGTLNDAAIYEKWNASGRGRGRGRGESESA